MNIRIEITVTADSFYRHPHGRSVLELENVTRQSEMIPSALIDAMITAAVNEWLREKDAADAD